MWHHQGATWAQTEWRGTARPPYGGGTADNVPKQADRAGRNLARECKNLSAVPVVRSKAREQTCWINRMATMELTVVGSDAVSSARSFQRSEDVRIKAGQHDTRETGWP